MPTLSQRLAAYVRAESFERLPAEVVARAKHLLAYHIALAFRARRLDDPDVAQAITVARQLSEGHGSATIIGEAHGATLVEAAMVNCTMMRAQGLDDVIFPSGIHPGLVTLPVALALAERERRSGAELILAIVTAYEVLGKFGRWTWSAQVPRRATMSFGPFGGAALATRLLRLDEAQASAAFGYGAHTAMGLAQGDTGPVSHYYSLVCRNAVATAYLARAGGRCSPEVLEGQYGFLETFFGDAQIDAEALIAALGQDFIVLHACEKRTPGTALNQVPIEMLRHLLRTNPLAPEAIASITIDLPEERRNFAAGQSPGPFDSATRASSSLLYQLALLLLGRAGEPEAYDRFDDPSIAALIARMRVVWHAGRPIRHAGLHLHRHDGTTLHAEGEDWLFPPESIATMLRREAGDILPPERVATCVAMLEELEAVADVSTLMNSLRPSAR